MLELKERASVLALLAAKVHHSKLGKLWWSHQHKFLLALPSTLTTSPVSQSSNELRLNPFILAKLLNLEGNSPPRGHQFCSVTQSCPTLCDLMTIARQASLSITKPKACSNLCPSSQEYHPTISSSVIPFPSCLQFFPA